MRIFLIDDHELFRLGLRTMLETHGQLEVVGEAGHVASGLERIGALKPDVVVVDYALPDQSGIEAIALIKRRHPAVSVVLLTASRSQSVYSEALLSGADGVVLKQDSGEAIVDAILNSHKSEPSISAAIKPSDLDDKLDALTKRERQVLRMIVQGYRNREISEQLHVSLKTVDSHRTNLMRKLDIHNLVDLVALANETGLMDSSI